MNRRLLPLLSTEFKATVPYLAPVVAEGLTAGALLTDPSAFFLSSREAALSALALLGWAAYRFCQWRTKLLAEQALTLNGFFEVATIPQNPAGDGYLGRGFEWTGRDAQRLINLERQRRLTTLDTGGQPALHGVGFGREQDVFIPVSELGGHLLVTGATGTGKTRLLELLIGQAIRRGDAVIVIDPKWDRDPRGGLLDRMYEAAVPCGRADQFRFVSLLYPQRSLRTNPLQNFAMAVEIPDRLAELLPGQSGDAQSFREYARGFLSKIVQAQLEVNERPTLENLRTYYLLRDQVEELLRRQPAASRAGDGLQWILAHPREHLQKIISILDPLFEKLTAADIGHTLSPTAADWARGEVLDYERILKQSLVCYVNTGSLALGDTGYTIAKLWLQDFVAFVGRHYAYGKTLGQPITVVIDEFGQVASRASVDLLNKGRGGGLRMVLGAQTFADLRLNLGEDGALQVMGNCNTRISLRADDYEMARAFSDLVGKVSLQTLRRSVTVSPNSEKHAPIFDSSYKIDATEQADALVRPEWISGLPKGQAFVHLGGKVWKLRIPLLPPVTTRYPLEVAHSAEVAV